VGSEFVWTAVRSRVWAAGPEAHDRQDSHNPNRQGFRFIKVDAGKDYFFHQSAIGEGLADLREGDNVGFEIGRGRRVPR
jgi:cold shock CspA family protein